MVDSAEPGTNSGKPSLPVSGGDGACEREAGGWCYKPVSLCRQLVGSGLSVAVDVDGADAEGELFHKPEEMIPELQSWAFNRPPSCFLWFQTSSYPRATGQRIHLLSGLVGPRGRFIYRNTKCLGLLLPVAAYCTHKLR